MAEGGEENAITGVSTLGNVSTIAITKFFVHSGGRSKLFTTGHCVSVSLIFCLAFESNIFGEMSTFVCLSLMFSCKLSVACIIISYHCLFCG